MTIFALIVCLALYGILTGNGALLFLLVLASIIIVPFIR